MTVMSQKLCSDGDAIPSLQEDRKDETFTDETHSVDDYDENECLGDDNITISKCDIFAVSLAQHTHYIRMTSTAMS